MAGMSNTEVALELAKMMLPRDGFQPTPQEVLQAFVAAEGVVSGRTNVKLALKGNGFEFVEPTKP